MTSYSTILVSVTPCSSVQYKIFYRTISIPQSTILNSLFTLNYNPPRTMSPPIISFLLLLAPLLSAQNDDDTIFNYLSTNPASSPSPYSTHPVYLLSIGDMSNFLSADFNLINQGWESKEAEGELWLVWQLAERLAGGVKAGAGKLV